MIRKAEIPMLIGLRKGVVDIASSGAHQIWRLA
jgi:hypothetical protein